MTAIELNHSNVQVGSIVQDQIITMVTEADRYTTAKEIIERFTVDTLHFVCPVSAF